MNYYIVQNINILIFEQRVLIYIRLISFTFTFNVRNRTWRCGTCSGVSTWRWGTCCGVLRKPRSWYFKSTRCFRAWIRINKIICTCWWWCLFYSCIWFNVRIISSSRYSTILIKQLFTIHSASVLFHLIKLDSMISTSRTWVFWIWRFRSSAEQSFYKFTNFSWNCPNISPNIFSYVCKFVRIVIRIINKTCS
uniref:Uncharacterized protein n=1 Tax=Porodaedalea pini TaxID=108901 RepID=A0A5B9RJX3_9AGAM|nr:hypothetical protein PPIT_000112 [Porodaedalea pini]QEG57007.1 hypothetical protein PPIT_000112 [Porodaedalea pini]